MTAISKITLVSQTFDALDDIGQPTVKETTTDIFAEVVSVTSNEYFEGRQNGLSPDLRCRVSRFGYNGEKTVSYNGKRYSVYKTYESDNNYVDLYCEEELGTSG